MVVPASAGTTKIGYRRAGLGMYHVYILASRRHGTLYIGVTNSLLARLAQHRSGKGAEFVQKYKVYRLVYVESYTTGPTRPLRAKSN